MRQAIHALFDSFEPFGPFASAALELNCVVHKS